MTGQRATAAPSVAILVPNMDRSDELNVSLPSFLGQDYPNYSVTVLDHSSRDGIAAAMDAHACVRLHQIDLPRPRYWSFSRARNAGLRYTESELVLFIDGDTTFRNAEHLSEAVEAYLQADADYEWWRRWRVKTGLSCVTPGQPVPMLDVVSRKVYCHTLGSLLLVERRALQALGGYNQLLADWGYEDTDMLARLELSGFGRIELDGFEKRDQPDAVRLSNMRVKDKELTWERNRRLSDAMIATYGVINPHPNRPGFSRWASHDGTRRGGTGGSAGPWTMPAGSNPAIARSMHRLRSRLQCEILDTRVDRFSPACSDATGGSESSA